MISEANDDLLRAASQLISDLVPCSRYYLHLSTCCSEFCFYSADATGMWLVFERTCSGSWVGYEWTELDVASYSVGWC